MTSCEIPLTFNVVHPRNSNIMFGRISHTDSIYAYNMATYVVLGAQQNGVRWRHMIPIAARGNAVTFMHCTAYIMMSAVLHK